MKFFSEQLLAITFLLFFFNFKLTNCTPASGEDSGKGSSKPPAFHQKEQRFIHIDKSTGKPLDSRHKNINAPPIDRFPQNYGDHGSSVMMKYDRNTGSFVGEKAKPLTKAQTNELHQSLSSAVKEAKHGSHSGSVSPTQAGSVIPKRAGSASPTRAGSVSPRRGSVSPRRASPKRI